MADVSAKESLGVSYFLTLFRPLVPQTALEIERFTLLDSLRRYDERLREKVDYQRGY